MDKKDPVVYPRKNFLTICSHFEMAKETVKCFKIPMFHFYYFTCFYLDVATDVKLHKFVYSCTYTEVCKASKYSTLRLSHFFYLFRVQRTTPVWLTHLQFYQQNPMPLGPILYQTWTWAGSAHGLDCVGSEISMFMVRWAQRCNQDFRLGEGLKLNNFTPLPSC